MRAKTTRRRDGEPTGISKYRRPGVKRGREVDIDRTFKACSSVSVPSWTSSWRDTGSFFFSVEAVSSGLSLAADL
jgi:hypothetical protein